MTRRAYWMLAIGLCIGVLLHTSANQLAFAYYAVFYGFGPAAGSGKMTNLKAGDDILLYATRDDRSGFVITDGRCDGPLGSGNVAAAMSANGQPEKLGCAFLQAQTGNVHVTWTDGHEGTIGLDQLQWNDLEAIEPGPCCHISRQRRN
jgi:hypothetical protein